MARTSSAGARHGSGGSSLPSAFITWAGCHAGAHSSYPEKDQLPGWAVEVFDAIADAVQGLPAHHRDIVVAAAVKAWCDSDRI